MLLFKLRITAEQVLEQHDEALERGLQLVVRKPRRERRNGIATTISMPISGFSQEYYSAQSHSMKCKGASSRILTTLVIHIQGAGTIADVQNSVPPVRGMCFTPFDNAPAIQVDVKSLGNQRCRPVPVPFRRHCIHISSENDQSFRLLSFTPSGLLQAQYTYKHCT